ncbi:MAG: glycoside hydrolase family 9 protein [Lachnospiraceae bacterium]|nr:glycoside hydrolase family 9 protein [Lachnospiraceae bacterium]
MKNRHFRILICILLSVALLTGCAYASELSFDARSKSDGDSGFTTLGLTPEFNYEVPRSLPNILVDQVGYDRYSNKIAVFQGELLPDSFTVTDAVSGQSVYTGQIERRGYDEKTGVYVSYGDFTSLQTTGTYYIEAAVVGQSYNFEIADNPYAELYNVALKQYYFNRCGLTLSLEMAGDAAHNACHAREAQMKDEASIKLDVSGGWHVDGAANRDVSTGCRTVNHLLLAYELYPEVFGDDVGIPESGNGIPDVLDEVKYEIDWLLKMQDSKSGAVYSAVSNVDNAALGYLLYIEGITMDATIQFAAAMAKFSYLYQNYDWEFANRCLKAADRAYRYAGKYPADVSPEEYFYAAAELYRATGNYGYHNVIKNYLLENPVEDMQNDFTFWGCVTYLSTKQKVDMNLCKDMIKVLMLEGEKISYAAKNSKFLVIMDEKSSGSAELLKDITRLVVVDHIITNHEYATVLQNHLHYMLGRNLQSISYLDSAGTRNYKEIDEKYGIMNQVELNAELVLMMSSIMDELRPEEDPQP